MKQNPCKKCENRKSEKLSKVCPVLAGSPQNRSGGVGSDAGVPRAFDTFHNPKQYMCRPFATPPDGNIEVVGLGLNGALEGRNCLRGIIGDSGTFHLRCLGGPCKVLEPASRDPRQFWCLRHNSFIKSSEKSVRNSSEMPEKNNSGSETSRGRC